MPDETIENIYSIKRRFFEELEEGVIISSDLLDLSYSLVHAYDTTILNLEEKLCFIASEEVKLLESKLEGINSTSCKANAVEFVRELEKDVSILIYEHRFFKIKRFFNTLKKKRF